MSSSPKSSRNLAPVTPMKPTFDEWYAELRTLAAAANWDVTSCGQACWFDFHEDGDSPADALQNDMDAAMS